MGSINAVAKHACNRPSVAGAQAGHAAAVLHEMPPILHCTQLVQDFMAFGYCSGIIFVLWHRGDLNCSS